MADVPLVSNAISPAPKDYTIPLAQEIVVKSVRAAIDGSGAGGPYLPALQVIAPNGDVMSTSVASSAVSAGASVDANWFPGVKEAAAAASGSGLQYNSGTYGPDNVGDWLVVETNNNMPAGSFTQTAGADTSNYGQAFNAGAGGMLVTSDPFVTDNWSNPMAKIQSTTDALGTAGPQTVQLLQLTSRAFHAGLSTDGLLIGVYGTGQQEGAFIEATGTPDPLGGDPPGTGDAVTVDALNLLAQSKNATTTGAIILADTRFVNGTLTGGSGNAIGANVTARSNTGTCTALKVQCLAGGAGTKKEIQVLDSSGNPIFEVRDDGSLHGKTGQALTFDL